MHLYEEMQTKGESKIAQSKKPPKFRHLQDTVEYNIICLPGEPGDELHPFRACSEVVPMSTYEELSLIVSVALLIVTILNYTHKK